MTSGLARLPFVRSPLLDERVCPLQKHVAMTRAGKDDIRSRCTAPEQQSEGALWQGEFVVQLQEMALRLFFRRPTEPAGVVINDDALSGLNQLANLAPENVLAGFALSGPQVGALDAIIGIEKHEVALGGRLESSLEPVRAGTGALILAVANVLGCGLFVGELVRNRRLSLESQARLKALVETSPAANRDRG